MTEFLVFIFCVGISLVFAFFLYLAIWEETNLGTLTEETDEVKSYFTKGFIFFMCYLFIQLSVYAVYLFTVSMMSLLKQ